MKMKQTENEVKKAIKEYLEYNKYTVYRINNAGGYRGDDTQVKPRFSFAGTPGVADLYAVKKGDYLVGRGASDMKGQVVASIAAMEAVMKAGGAPVKPAGFTHPAPPRPSDTMRPSTPRCARRAEALPPACILVKGDERYNR